MKGFPKQILESVEGIAGRILGAALAVSAVLICFLQIDEIQKLSLAGQAASWLLVVLICLMEGMYVVLILTTEAGLHQLYLKPNSTIAVVNSNCAPSSG